MNEKPMSKETLLESVNTREDKEILSNELDVLIQGLYKTDHTFQTLLDTDIRAQTRDAILKDFSTNSIQITDTENIKLYLTNIKTELENLKMVELTLAFHPTQEVISSIHDWIKENVGSGYLLKLLYNPSLLGGAIIAVNGIYKDFSLQKSLDEYFEKKKEEIVRSLSEPDYSPQSTDYSS